LILIPFLIRFYRHICDQDPTLKGIDIAGMLADKPGPGGITWIPPFQPNSPATGNECESPTTRGLSRVHVRLLTL